LTDKIYFYREKNEIEVSVDAGWQKRGSGKAYNSLSGMCILNCFKKNIKLRSVGWVDR
jgi:hypothetical protein